jgi:hypothetical protein
MVKRMSKGVWVLANQKGKKEQRHEKSSKQRVSQESPFIKRAG